MPGEDFLGEEAAGEDGRDGERNACATGMKDTRRACRLMAWLRVRPLARAVLTKSALTLSSRYWRWAIWYAPQPTIVMANVGTA